MANTTNKSRVQTWREKNAEANRLRNRNYSKSIMSGKSYRRSLGKLKLTFSNKLNQNLYIRPNGYKDFLSNIYIR